LAERHPDLRIVVPTTETVAEIVGAAVKGWAAPALVLRGQQEKYDAFAASNAALAASGTVALELAMARVPTVIAYRVSPLTHAVARRMFKVEHAHLLNLILGRTVVPELIQQDCTPERLAAAVGHLLSDAGARTAQIEACEEGLRRLGQGGVSPGLRAADTVLAVIAAHAQGAVRSTAA
jgi:lipid-A-disaccharide synthase